MENLYWVIGIESRDSQSVPVLTYYDSFSDLDSAREYVASYKSGKLFIMKTESLN